MEKVFFSNNNGDLLAGIINKSNNNGHRYIIMVHGFTGNKDEKGLFKEAASYFLKSGFSVFRFDIRGCGESQGDFKSVGLEEQKGDLLAALSFLKKKESLDDNNIYMIGFSLGATVSLMGYDNYCNIRAIALWSPALFPNRDMYPRYLDDTIVNELHHNGYFIKSGLKVGKKIMNDLRDCNLVPILECIKRPTLIVHGEKDTKISAESSRMGSCILNGRSRLKLITDACHSFRSPDNARETLFNTTIDFFISA
jgi:hypothetical protein